MREPLDRTAEESPTPDARGARDASESQGHWTTFSAACLILAVPFLLTGQMRAAFVVATLGVVAWFLNVRQQLKRKYPDEEDAAAGSFYDDEDDDETDEDDAGDDADGGGDDGDGGGDDAD